MSETSKAISLKNLALRLCGEPTDSDNITSDDVARVLATICHILHYGDGELKAWYKDKVYPPLESSFERLFSNRKFEGKTTLIRDIDWPAHAEEHAHSIRIAKADFEAFLNNDDEAKRALTDIKNTKADFLRNWEGAKKEPHGGKTLKVDYRRGIKRDGARYKNAVAEKSHLKDLYEKNQPYHSTEAGQVVPPQTGGVSHSDDFRSMTVHGEEYSFTSKQASVVNYLYKQHPHEVSDAMLIEEFSLGSRVRDSFRDHPAWGTLIVEGGTKGTRRLYLDPKS